MKKMICVALVSFVLVVSCHTMSWAELGSSLDSSDLESGQEEMNQMDSSMDVQPGDSTSSLESEGMNVQSGDAIDSEGTGAH
jgi:hypothetical protein